MSTSVETSGMGTILTKTAIPMITTVTKAVLVPGTSRLSNIQAALEFTELFLRRNHLPVSRDLFWQLYGGGNIEPIGTACEEVFIDGRVTLTQM